MGPCAVGGGGGLAASSARALRLLVQRSWLLEKTVVAEQVEKHAQVVSGERRTKQEEAQICTGWELELKTSESQGVGGREEGEMCRSMWLQGSVETKKRGEQGGTLWDRFASSLKVSPRDASSSPYLMNDPRLVEPSLPMVPWHFSRMSGVCIEGREKTLVPAAAHGMMQLPGMEDDDMPLEASSVKRKRKKKMNKHKQRKLRRRDRHRN